MDNRKGCPYEIYGYRTRKEQAPSLQCFITLFKNQRKTVVLLPNKHNERESRAQGAACYNIVRWTNLRILT